MTFALVLAENARTLEIILIRDHLGHRGFLGETCGYGYLCFYISFKCNIYYISQFGPGRRPFSYRQAVGTGYVEGIENGIIHLLTYKRPLQPAAADFCF